MPSASCSGEVDILSFVFVISSSMADPAPRESSTPSPINHMMFVNNANNVLAPRQLRSE